jgi:hypothetical protein
VEGKIFRAAFPDGLPAAANRPERILTLLTPLPMSTGDENTWPFAPGIFDSDGAKSDFQINKQLT